MKSLVIVLVALLVVSAVSVGAYNIVNGTNNKPLSFHRALSSLSNLNFDFFISTDTLEGLINHFKRWSDWSYQATDEYKNASSLEKFLTDWVNHSLIINLPILLFEVVSLVCSLVLDFLILVYQLFVFVKEFLLGVPST